MLVTHTFEPIYDKNSQILILGSMPSLKSREYGFYYMHPRNRFWTVLGKVFDEEIPASKEEKIAFLLKKKIALFDVLKSCEIKSSSDSSIKNPLPNDLKEILENSNIKTIFTTGLKAYELYQKYLEKETKIKAIYLPSTSPANAKLKVADLLKEYQKIKNYL